MTRELRRPAGGSSVTERVALRLRRVTSSAHHYIAEIDGLRFIAIFSVLFFHVFYAATHVAGTVLTPTSYSAVLWPIRYGSRGVELFFVISGFILGLPFAAYHLADGRRISIGRYYLRRVTRLEPPYIVTLLLFYAAAVLLRTPDAAEPGFFSGLLLRLGYLFSVVRGSPATLDGVTWTLEVEVQFYLLVPLFAGVFALPARYRRGILAILACGLPFVAPMIPLSHLTLVGFAHFFFMGFLLADLHTTGVAAGRPSPCVCDLLGITGLLAVALIPPNPVFNVLFPWLLAAMFVAALRGKWFRAIMRHPVISVLGGMCYSLYLLHYPILSFLAQKIVHNGMSVLCACLLVGLIALPVAIGAGILFYIFLERPCMNPNWPRAAVARVARVLRLSSVRAEADVDT